MVATVRATVLDKTALRPLILLLYDESLCRSSHHSGHLSMGRYYRPPGTLELPDKFHLESKYVDWDGLLCREDPFRAFLNEQKEGRRGRTQSVHEARMKAIENLRENRAQLYGLQRQV